MLLIVLNMLISFFQPTLPLSNAETDFGSAIEKTIQLSNGFQVDLGRSEDLNSFITYTLFILSKNGEVIFIDSSLTEYDFTDTLYPLVHKIGKEKYELCFAVNDRPNKSYLIRYLIDTNRVINTDTLPTFICGEKNLDADNFPEYAGFIEYAEIWDSAGVELAPYNPLLYYEQTPDGIKLDSALTIFRNKVIYGEFYGFSYDEKRSFLHLVQRERIKEEIDRIRRTID